MTNSKYQRVDPAVQAIDDAIELFRKIRNPLIELWDEREKKSIELGITALHYMKGSLYDK